MVTPVDLIWARAKVASCLKSQERDAPEYIRYFTAEEVEELLDEIEELRRDNA